MRGVRCAIFTPYGSLVQLAGGSPELALDDASQMGIALRKTIDEFKMWASMSRKPGQPEEYMREVYMRALGELRMAPSAEKNPEVQADQVWLAIVKKLFAKDYKFDTGTYGSLNEYVKKVAFFYQMSLQGAAAYPNAGSVLLEMRNAGWSLGLWGDGQCFTAAHVAHLIRQKDLDGPPTVWFPESLEALSYEVKARKPSESLTRLMARKLEAAGIEPFEAVHIGCDAARDIGPAKKLGMKTVLYAGDRAALAATPDQLKDPATRPDALVTDLSQLVNLIV